METLIFIVVYVVLGIINGICVSKRMRDIAIEKIADDNPNVVIDRDLIKPIDDKTTEYLGRLEGIKVDDGIWKSLGKALVPAVLSIAVWPILTPFTLISMHFNEDAIAEDILSQ